jgi:1,4-dihydroxy-6-naphthoate synthase
MNRTLTLGYSPCPNDTFIFHALAEGRISVEPYRFDITLADVEVLNQRAREGSLHVSKVSIHAMLHLLDEYWLLRSGGALGRGCGPLVVAREGTTMEELAHKSIAIPGRMTTANLLLRLHGAHRGPSVEMSFDRIMQAVANGEVDAGVIIHEGRFTYPAMGLKLVLDLGDWWERRMGVPLPLGGIVIRRDLGLEVARFVEAKIRESLAYARSRPEEAWPYIRAHAQEMEPQVIRRHIDMFVNDFSRDVGEEGEKAIRTILEAASKLENLPLPNKPVFRDRTPIH